MRVYAPLGAGPFGGGGGGKERGGERDKLGPATKKYTKDAQFELDILERVKRRDPLDR